MRRSPLVSDSDRFAAAALTVERLQEWAIKRTAKRAEALPELPRWDHYLSSDAGIRSEAPDMFPGPRSAWVR